jgi:thioredoxin-related protein
VVLLAFTTVLSINAAPSAESIMKEAQKKAEAEGKNVFLSFSTTGCAWCKVLENFINSEEVMPIFTKYFVPVQLMLGDDANTNPGASVTRGNMARREVFLFMRSSLPTERKSWIRTRMGTVTTLATQRQQMRLLGLHQW